MATKNNGKAKEAAKASKENRGREGWDSVSSDRNAPWLQKAEGKSIEGELLGRFTMTLKGKEKAFYQIRVTNPGGMEAKLKGEDPEEIKKGDVVSFDEFAGVRDLAPLAGDGGRYLVAIDFIELEDRDDGTSRWVTKTFKKTLSPPTRAPAPVARTTSNVRDESDGEDIPF